MVVERAERRLKRLCDEHLQPLVEGLLPSRGNQVAISYQLREDGAALTRRGP
jgi:hypothetical protein